MKALATTAKTYTAIENALRQAMAASHPVTLGELYANPDIARVVKGVQQIRDCVATLKRTDKVDQIKVDKKTRGGYTAAFSWREGATPFAIGTKPATRAAKAPSKAIVTDYAAPNPNEVELVLNGLTVIAGMNPATGRIRIQIEGVTPK